MFFCKLWPGKTSGFHVRYRFKVIPWRATGESPFEYVEKCMEITNETLNGERFNASWSEILIEENVPCKVDIPSLLNSLFK